MIEASMSVLGRRITRLPVLLAAIGFTVVLGGCVVAPAGPPLRPAGVAYVAPTYAVPGPGYDWRYHQTHGWGWWHARQGWHRGW